MKKTTCLWLACSLMIGHAMAAAPVPDAAQPNQAPAAPTERVLVGVYDSNEYALDSRIADNYAPLTERIASNLHRPVSVEVIKSNRTALRGIAAKHYTFLFVRYPYLAARALKDGYQMLLASDEKISIKFIVNKTSSLASPADTVGKTWAADAFSGDAGLAEMKHLGFPVSADHIKPANQCGAAAFMVKNGYADIGMIVSDRASEWTSTGGRVLFESRQFPSWSLVASSRLAQDAIKNVQSDLLAYLQAPENDKLLKNLGIGPIVAGNPQSYLDALMWMAPK